MLAEKERIANGLKDKKEWHLYHKKLPMTHVPLANPLPDKMVKKEANLYLEKEKWETAFVLLARQVNDETIVGKPQIQKYFKPMKPEHKDREFDATYKQFKFIS